MIQGVTGAARSLLREARRAGLLPVGPEPDDADATLVLLREAAVPQPTQFSQLDDPQADLTALDERRRSLLRQLQDLREEIGDVERLNREATEFEGEAREQEARLTSIGLVSAEGDSDSHM